MFTMWRCLLIKMSHDVAGHCQSDMFSEHCWPGCIFLHHTIFRCAEWNDQRLPHVQDRVVHWGTEPEGDPQAADCRRRRVRLHAHQGLGFRVAGVALALPAFDTGRKSSIWSMEPAVACAPTALCINRRYIGLEMGSVWGRLGAQVTVVEFLDRIVPTMVRRPQNLGSGQGAEACCAVKMR